MAPTTHVIPDSTPLVDLYDLEAKWGYTHEGPFRGFKLHIIVNQLGLPLKAKVTPGNRPRLAVASASAGGFGGGFRVG
jgi:hypothetical protein